VAAKTLLKNKNVSFEEINLQNKPDEMVALKKRTGLMTVPQIFINDELIGGYSELSALEQKHELDALLG
jgi:glutaredoxin 3